VVFFFAMARWPHALDAARRMRQHAGKDRVDECGRSGREIVRVLVGHPFAHDAAHAGVQQARRQSGVGVGRKLTGADRTLHELLDVRHALRALAVALAGHVRELAGELGLVEYHLEHRLSPGIGRQRSEDRYRKLAQRVERVGTRRERRIAEQRVERQRRALAHRAE
jgi:hypothetical protein